MTATHTALLLLFTALVTANGLSPYLGLKWEYSMSMYSNMEYDCSNHLFLSGIQVANPEFYAVEAFEIAAETSDPFRKLLTELHSAGDESTGESHDLISADLVSYHAARLHRRGISFRFTLKEFGSGELIEISSDELPKRWQRYDLLLRYPQIRGNYHTLREMAGAPLHTAQPE